MRRHLPLLLIATLLSGCVTLPRLPGSAAPVAGNTVAAQQAMSSAFDQLGMPYRYGGSSPDTGFDCSGLVQFAFATGGVALPRTVAEQYRVVKPVGREALGAGDLVFFRTWGTQVSHVGIYVGEGRFIHAPKSGKRVMFSELGDGYWGQRFAGAGRI